MADGASNLFHRDLEGQMQDFLGRDEIIIIRGARQAGKTTLMKMLGERIKGKKEFIDFDIASSRNAITEAPIEYVERYLENGIKVLFFDEIQRLDDAGNILKIIYDNFKGRVKIIASGSSSLEINSKVLGALVGRAVVFDLMTMGFGEFVGARDKGLHKIFEERNSEVVAFIKGSTAGIEAPALSGEFLALWKEYIIYGGYPEIIKENKTATKEALLYNLVELYLEKDISSFFKVENTREFENFLKAIAFNDAQLFITSNVASDAGINVYTANKYISILSNTYLVELVYPYYKNASTAIKKTPKLYFMDLGMRNAVLKNLMPYESRTDSGKLAENFVFLELLRNRFGIKYWRTKSGAEMDFVLDINGKPFPVEVKLGRAGSLGKSFYSFIERYKPKNALVVTLNEFSKLKKGDTTIYCVPIYYI